MTNRHIRGLLQDVILLFISAFCLFAHPAVSQAAAITVTSLADSGAGSLRQAIADAASGDTINFSVTGTITLSSQLVIDRNLTIDGPGAAGLTISGDNAVRVFYVDSGGTLVLNSLTVANGNAGGGVAGGGIFNWGTVIVNSCTFANNRAIYGGGICNRGTVTISNSTFSGNSASSQVGESYGGGLESSGTATISNSTFSNNSSGSEGGGLRVPLGTTSISNSTFSGNSAYNGGGISINTSGNSGATLTISNSTFSGNSASSSGGGLYSFSFEASLLGHTVNITNSTFSGNNASAGGGIFINTSFCYIGGLSLINTSNSIITSNFGGNCSGMGQGANITNNGYNIDSGETCGLGMNNGSKSSTYPFLGLLGNNGGLTQTHALLAGSPAIDAIPAGVNGCGTTITTDQRGVARPKDSGCDIGSFEYIISSTVNALASSGSQKLYAGIIGKGIYLSSDGGSSWAEATKHPTNKDIRAILLKPGDPTTLFAATYGGGVFVSTDSGDTWNVCTNTNLANLNVVSMIINADGKLYAGTEAGVYVSSDNCENWTAINSGLPN